jgi:hypothetical protein
MRNPGALGAPTVARSLERSVESQALGPQGDSGEPPGRFRGEIITDVDV